MAVSRLRTRRDRREHGNLEALRDALADLAEGDGAPAILERLVTAVEREIASCSGWGFVMVEPHLYAQIVEYLDRHSTRPRKAIRLWAHLFSALPPDSNEVMLTRDELAEKIGVRPSDVSAIMGELQEVGAVYRERHGRGVRYFVNPRLGTHMGGAVRDRAQAAAPFLRLVGPDPEPEAA